MSAIDEIKKEIIERHQSAGPQPDTPAAQEAPKEKANQVKPAKKKMTKAEIEAYKQKMMEKEEARYLGKPAKTSKPSKPKAQKPKVEKKVEKKAEKKVEKPKPKEKERLPKMPKILPPLEPLYLLRIPGLPKGDLIAVCIVHGADT